MLRFSRVLHLDLKRIHEVPKIDLPKTYGSFTRRIRNLYAVDLLKNVISGLRSRTNAYKSSMPISHIALQKEHKETMNKLWGGMRTFLDCYPAVFELNNIKTHVRLRNNPNFVMTPQVAFDLLKRFVPRRGGIGLDDIALFAQKTNPTLMYEKFLLSDDCAATFIVKHNQHKKAYFFWKDDEALVDLGFQVGANKPVAYALEAAAGLVPTVPTYWVPFDECVKHMTKEETDRVFRTGYARLMFVLLGGIHYASYGTSQDIFVKRHPSFLQKAEDACRYNYEEFALTPERVLKLAFSLPSEAMALEKAQLGLFPSVKAWLQKSSAFSLSAIVRMFPEVISVEDNGKVSSRVRKEFPLFTPEAAEPSIAEEVAFEAHLSDPSSAVVFEALKKRVESPSIKVFFACYGHPALTRFLQKVDDPSAAEQRLLSHKEMIAIVEQGLGADEHVYVDDMYQKINQAVDRETHTLFRRTLSIRYGAQLTKLLTQYYSSDLRCEQLWANGRYGYHLYRRAPENEKSFANEFNSPEVLIREVVEQTRSMTSEKGTLPYKSKMVHIAKLIVTLSPAARASMKKHGGVHKFFEACPEHFEIVDGHYIRLKEDNPP